MIGIIIPPGEIKKMVEKTAYHVARNGSEFEKALIEMEQHKPEFSFLLKDNPYRSYYDHMVAEYSKKLLAENQENVEDQIPKQQAKEEELKNNNQQAAYLERVFEEIKEPQPDIFSASMPEKITKLDINMILHTAQYTAINGKNFLIALSQRQKNNPQFQFLRTSSQNHQFFKKLIEAYKAVQAFGNQQINRLQSYIIDRQAILNKCRNTFQYYQLRQEQNKDKKNGNENKIEKYVDWNDFELVETIVFDDYKANPREKTLKITPNLYSKNMEEKIISEPKRKQLLQQCHICKKHILSSQISKHLKNCLGSGGQKNQPQAIMNTEGGAQVDITKNLQNLSTKRPDIFGGQGQKIKLDEVQNKQSEAEPIIWDGQSSQMKKSGATFAFLMNEQKKMKESQNNSKK